MILFEILVSNGFHRNESPIQIGVGQITMTNIFYLFVSF